MHDTVDQDAASEAPPGRGTETDDVADAAAEESRFALWTRRPVCGRRTDIIDRLSSMEAGGQVGDVGVETWPDEVVVSKYPGAAKLLERYERFAQWAEEHGVSITPPFERRTVTPLVGNAREVLKVPMVCLAVYENGLQGVYPCSGPERTWRVRDYLDAHERTGGIPRPGETDLPVG